MKQHKRSFDSTFQSAACDRLPDERDSLETRFQQHRCSVIAGTQHYIVTLQRSNVSKKGA